MKSDGEIFCRVEWAAPRRQCSILCRRRTWGSQRCRRRRRDDGALHEKVLDERSVQGQANLHAELFLSEQTRLNFRRQSRGRYPPPICITNTSDYPPIYLFL